MTDMSGTEDLATEVPAGKIGRIPYKDLPDAPRLRKIVGPSAILMSCAIASGELIIWPFLSTQIGLQFFWGAIIGVGIQYFINMEIERYTLATGETAVIGFSRLWRGWGLVFVVAGIATFSWPGWTTAAATMFSFAFGGGNIALISILMLWAIGVTLILSPVVYKTVEKIAFAKIMIMLVFLAVALALVTTATDWGHAAQGFNPIGNLPLEQTSAVVLLGALTSAGAGGIGNLIQSNWARDKGLGMGVYIPRIVSPVTGQDVARAGTGALFRPNDTNLRRWKDWWKIANQEQLYLFLFLGVVFILAWSLLAYALLFERNVGGQGLDFIRVEGEVLKSSVAPLVGTLFWVVGGIALLYGALAVIEWVGRLTADVIKVQYLPSSVFWSESKIYFAVVWLLVVFGTFILGMGLSQPLFLLLISQVIHGPVMCTYSILLLRLNSRALPAAIRPKIYRLAIVAGAAALYGVATIYVIMDVVGG